MTPARSDSANPIGLPVGGRGLTGVTGKIASKMLETTSVTTITGIAQSAPPATLHEGRAVEARDPHRAPIERAHIDDQQTDQGLRRRPPAP